MEKRIYAGIFMAVFAILSVAVYKILDEMGWQFALGVLFGTAIYQFGYYCKHGFGYGP